MASRRGWLAQNRDALFTALGILGPFLVGLVTDQMLEAMIFGALLIVLIIVCRWMVPSARMARKESDVPTGRSKTDSRAAISVKDSASARIENNKITGPGPAIQAVRSKDVHIARNEIEKTD